MPGREIMIAGGGIGGVSAALCFAQQGDTVQVFEQSDTFGEVGAGIQLSPNCTRVLHHLGLAPALDTVAFRPRGTQMRDWRSGDVITENALGDDVKTAYGFPYYHIHRGDLMQVLAEAAAASPRITLHTGARVTDVEQTDDTVAINAGGRRFDGDLLVGADGIHSIVRGALFGPDAPTFTGNIAWRALIPTDRLPEDLVRPVATAWWGPGKHFVHYYVRGGALVNCVCVVEKASWTQESWTERGDHGELKADFAGWHDDIQCLIDNMDRDACFKWALFDRPPMPVWSRGRITLLGDACHPTLPFMAQGAAMAIEDGAVLASCVAASTDITAGLQHYEGLRRERTSRIQDGSRRNARLFHLSGADAESRNETVAASRGQVLDWLYRYDALSVASA